MKRVNIPQTDSIEELARFWDTHDLTEFEDQLEEVSEPVFERSPEAVVTLTLATPRDCGSEASGTRAGYGRGNIAAGVGAREAAQP